MPKLPNVQRQKAAPPIYLGGSEVTAPAKGLVPVSPTTPAHWALSFHLASTLPTVPRGRHHYRPCLIEKKQEAQRS